MKKIKLLILMLGTITILAACSTGNTGTDSSTESVTEASSVAEGNTKADETETQTEKTTAETDAEDSIDNVSYQSILDDYTQKIKDATPGLVEEYNSEATEASGDIQKLAELSNDKITKLAEICNEGITEMADLMLKNADEYDVYEEWAGKLQAVYTEYAEQITDAYMSSAS